MTADPSKSDCSPEGLPGQKETAMHRHVDPSWHCIRTSMIRSCQCLVSTSVHLFGLFAIFEPHQLQLTASYSYIDHFMGTRSYKNQPQFVESKPQNPNSPNSPLKAPRPPPHRSLHASMAKLSQISGRTTELLRIHGVEDHPGLD